MIGDRAKEHYTTRWKTQSLQVYSFRILPGLVTNRGPHYCTIISGIMYVVSRRSGTTYVPTRAHIFHVAFWHMERKAPAIVRNNESFLNEHRCNHREKGTNRVVLIWTWALITSWRNRERQTVMARDITAYIKRHVYRICCALESFFNHTLVSTKRAKLKTTVLTKIALS